MASGDGMFKNRSEYITILENMYQDIFSSLQLNWNYHPWPVIRVRAGFFFHFIYYGKKSNNSPVNDKLPEYRKHQLRLQDVLLFLISSLKLIAFRTKLSDSLQNKTLLVGRYKDAKQVKDFGAYNIYLHPLQKLLAAVSEKSEVLLLGDNKRKSVLSYLSLYETLYRIAKFNFHLSSFYKKDKLAAYKNSVLVYNHFSSHNLPSPVEIFNIVYSNLMENEIRYQAFVSFLSITKPKAIWTYCYYDSTFMALVRAGNQLNIHTIEYQHSSQSDGHLGYAKWQHADVYSSSFPQTFWQWKQSDADRIKRNFWCNNYQPDIILGGNLYLAQEKEKIDKFHTQNSYGKKNGILICLQGNWIPRFIEEVIARTKNYVWYFRLHPRYPNDKEKLDQLKIDFSDRIEVDLANRLSLYELFAHVKYSLTSFSGTALEAQAFDVQNIIFGEEGRSTYHLLIENKAFFYVTSSSELQTIIDEQAKLDLDSDKIIVDKKIVSGCIGHLFKTVS